MAWRLALVLLVAAIPTRPSPVFADSIDVGVGRGNDARQQAVAVDLDRASPVHRFRDADLTAHLQFAYGEIVGLSPALVNNTIHVGAIMPALQLQPQRWPVYAEAGVGFALLSKTVLNADRYFSTSFQFTEFVGAGVLLGPGRHLQAGVRVQHVSNGGIQEPNSGISFVAGYVGWRFR